MGLQSGDATASYSTARAKRPTVNVYDTKNKLVCGTARKYQVGVCPEFPAFLPTFPLNGVISNAAGREREDSVLDE